MWMAYTLGNKCAKNCCKRTIPVQLMLEDVVSGHNVFLEHSVDLEACMAEAFSTPLSGAFLEFAIFMDRLPMSSTHY